MTMLKNVDFVDKADHFDYLDHVGCHGENANKIQQL